MTKLIRIHTENTRLLSIRDFESMNLKDNSLDIRTTTDSLSFSGNRKELEKIFDKICDFLNSNDTLLNINFDIKGDSE